MKRTNKLIAIIIITQIVAGGCSAKLISKKLNEENNAKAQKLEITKEDSRKIKNLITDYFVTLYGETIGSYSNNHVTGALPEKIKDFLSRETWMEENSPEIGIHFPRYVALYGHTITGYEIMEEKGGYAINPAYMGVKDGGYLFYTDIKLKANCIPNDVFDENFTLNEHGFYIRSTQGELDTNKIDTIKVQVKYDVHVAMDKTDNKYKIVYAKEANVKPGYRNRLIKLNNDFVTKIPYLNLEKDEKKKYIDAESGDIYEKDGDLIKFVFENIFKNITSEQMDILYERWNEGLDAYQYALTEACIAKHEMGQDVLVIDNNCKDKYNFNSLLLKPDMKKIMVIKNINIKPHPLFSKKYNVYEVNFDVVAEINSGIVGDTCEYFYEYTVELSGSGVVPKLTGLMLNNYDKK